LINWIKSSALTSLTLLKTDIAFWNSLSLLAFPDKEGVVFFQEGLIPFPFFSKKKSLKIFAKCKVLYNEGKFFTCFLFLSSLLDRVLGDVPSFDHYFSHLFALTSSVLFTLSSWVWKKRFFARFRKRDKFRFWWKMWLFKRNYKNCSERQWFFLFFVAILLPYFLTLVN